MPNRYYAIVRYLLDDVNESLLAGRCIQVLHGVMASTKNQIDRCIGVTFPMWSQSSIGGSVGFVSTSKEALEHLLSQHYFQQMKANDIFSLSAVSLVPDGLSEIRFIRNQGIAKCFAGEKRRRLERAKRRAESRGELFQPRAENSYREFDFFHRVQIFSGSTSQNYLLHIQRAQTTTRHDDDFSSYGLATNEHYMGTVPDLPVSLIFRTIKNC